LQEPTFERSEPLRQVLEIEVGSIEPDCRYVHADVSSKRHHENFVLGDSFKLRDGSLQSMNTDAFGGIVNPPEASLTAENFELNSGKREA